MPFNFKQARDIPEVIVVESQQFIDDRGFFMEIYKKSDFDMNGIRLDFKQDAYSCSKKGVVRGLHYQLNPNAQGKLVRVITGKILDIAVDIRKNSPTFKKWVAIELNTDNKLSLYIPPGFAHGFMALEDDTRVVYKLSDEYNPSLDRGIRYNDPDINISWPEIEPIVSEKDSKLPFLAEAEIFI